MAIITRRHGLALGASALALSAAPRRARAALGDAGVEPPKMPVEKGASLRVLRPAKFVGPDQVIWDQNTERFTKETGVKVRTDYVGWEDLRPQTAVSARTGAGPDVVVGWPDDPHLYADKLIPMTELAGYLGRKYGGWYFLAEKYGQKHASKDWISIPMGGSGAPCVYRESWVKDAGFDGIPTDLDQYLALCRNLKKNNRPAGFALGNAVGDGNAFCNWLLWSHGGKVVNEDGQVALDSKATIDALKYAKEMYPSLINGTLGWNDSSNNKAFVSGDISMTQNGVSVYFALKNDPSKAEQAADVNHAHMPFGAPGKPAEAVLMLNAMVFKHTKYPNAAQNFLRFMMEEEQYVPWLTGCVGYWSQPLKAYANAPVWSSDPKIAVYRDSCGNGFWNGYAGPISSASSAVTADYVVVHMFAAAASGSSSPEDAAKDAASRAQRYYKS